MERQEILRNLARKTLSDQDYEHLTTFFSFSAKCPTCDDTKKYWLDGVEHDCDCQIQKLLQKHYLAANIPSRYHDICLEPHFIGKDRDEVLKVANGYIDNFESNAHYGLGLTFAGSYGTGKTFVMTSILKSLLKRGYSTYFITFDELINVWANYSDDAAKQLLTNRLLSASILGIDELKTDPRNANGFLQNGLDNVIRHRTSNRLPTLITTNMTPTEEEREFPKVFSLLSEANDKVFLTGEDVRGGQVAKTNKQLARLGERRPIC